MPGGAVSIRVEIAEVHWDPGGRADIALPGGGLLRVRGRCGASPREVSGVVFPAQVHGAVVLRNPAPGDEGDALITTVGCGSPGLRVADCLPLAAAGPGWLGMAHAGWRGLASGIVERFAEAFPAEPRILAAGPCICRECYEVAEDVRLTSSGSSAGPGLHPPGRLDLMAEALARLCDAGLSCPVLSIAECTRCRPDLFHSYRRDGTALRNILWIEG